MGFEPTTPTSRLCSTPELHPRRAGRDFERPSVAIPTTPPSATTSFPTGRSPRRSGRSRGRCEQGRPTADIGGNFDGPGEARRSAISPLGLDRRSSGQKERHGGVSIFKSLALPSRRIESFAGIKA